MGTKIFGLNIFRTQNLLKYLFYLASKTFVALKKNFGASKFSFTNYLQHNNHFKIQIILDSKFVMELKFPNPKLSTKH